jgi:hypothetical protein
MAERIGTANEGRMSDIAYAIHKQEERVTVAPVCRAFLVLFARQKARKERLQREYKIFYWVNIYSYIKPKSVELQLQLHGF